MLNKKPGRRVPVYADTIAFVKRVLVRDHEEFCVVPMDDGNFEIFVKNASQQRIREILSDARCERIREKNKEKTGLDIPVYTKKDLRNADKIKRLQKINRTTQYVILN